MPTEHDEMQMSVTDPCFAGHDDVGNESAFYLLVLFAFLLGLIAASKLGFTNSREVYG